MSQTRIYCVIAKDGTQRLVEATSQNQAIRHVVTPDYRATIASPKTVAHLLQQGLKLEAAVHLDQVTQTT